MTISTEQETEASGCVSIALGRLVSEMGGCAGTKSAGSIRKVVPNGEFHQKDLGMNGLEIKEMAARQGAWGIASAIDIYNCNPDKIRSADTIRRFVAELCVLIDMKRFGETHVVHFGEDEKVAGFSMIQLIETSLISAHFANATNAVYLDVFSCKPYDPDIVRDFAEKYFEGTRSVLQVNLRA